MKQNEGIIKFKCNHIFGEAPEITEVQGLIDVRNRLHTLGLIGADEQGIGFGNISMRIAGSIEFYITGSQTGGKENLSPSDIARVTDYEISRNTLTCMGVAIASSESLTHAAVYESNPDISSVIHVHSNSIWEKLRGIKETTPEIFEYGTIEIAKEAGNLCSSHCDNVIVLGGHQAGIIITGKNINHAFELSRSLLNE